MNIQLSSLISVFLFSSLVFGETKPMGHEHGNGGGAIVCRDQNKKIISAELLDLWEARVSGRELDFPYHRSAYTMVEIGIDRIGLNNPFLAGRVREAYHNIKKISWDIPGNTALMPPTDAQHWMMKEGCALEGVAQYMTFPDRDQLYIDLEILKMMPQMDQAGLWLHEAIYKALRQDDGDTHSLRTRYMVTTLFESTQASPLKSDPNSNMTCFSHLNSDGTGFSTVLSIFLENGSLQAWAHRDQNKWLYPAGALKPLRTFDTQFEALFPFAFQSVGSREKWSKLPEVTTTSLVNGKLGLKQITLIMTRQEYDPHSPAFKVSVYVSPKTEARCTFP